MRSGHRGQHSRAPALARSAAARLARPAAQAAAGCPQHSNGSWRLGDQWSCGAFRVCSGGLRISQWPRLDLPHTGNNHWQQGRASQMHCTDCPVLSRCHTTGMGTSRFADSTAVKLPWHACTGTACMRSCLHAAHLTIGVEHGHIWHVAINQVHQSAWQGLPSQLDCPQCRAVAGSWLAVILRCQRRHCSRQNAACTKLAERSCNIRYQGHVLCGSVHPGKQTMVACCPQSMLLPKHCMSDPHSNA